MKSYRDFAELEKLPVEDAEVPSLEVVTGWAPGIVVYELNGDISTSAFPNLLAIV